jgi:phosphoribosylaminoimidazole-succinocarboxamide synthase
MRTIELGTPGPMRQRLNRLVREGHKVATFGLRTDYERELGAVERIGERLVLLGEEHGAGAVIEVVEVVDTRLGAVTWGQVEAAGEGFASIAEWRAAHEILWRGEGEAVDDGTEVVWLRFRVVDPRPLLPPRPTAADLDLPEGYQHIYAGKVRDLFRTPAGDLLVVASDRISAYDWVLPTAIPDKGAVLTQMSLWWFERLADLVPNHVIGADVPERVRGRALVCQQLQMYPVECVVRGYLTGSGLADYRRTGQVCGIALPPGLRDGDRLPHPVFTPATKAAVGDHDENIDFDHVVATVGREAAERLRDTAIAVYTRAEHIAAQRGIVLADTKFEFGHRADSDELVLADEVLTPDSSRFWPRESWEPGRPQPSFDKQYVRDWLTSAESGWDRSAGGPPPQLPAHVVAQTRDKYLDAYARLTGEPFDG